MSATKAAVIAHRNEDEDQRAVLAAWARYARVVESNSADEEEIRSAFDEYVETVTLRAGEEGE